MDPGLRTFISRNQVGAKMMMKCSHGWEFIT